MSLVLRFVVGVFMVLVLRVEALEAERIFFLSNGQVLQGCVYKPSGNGPFPAVVFLQSGVSRLGEGALQPFPVLAKFYIEHGYAFFVPGRHGSIKTDDSEKATESADTQKQIMDGLEKEADVMFSAVQALKAQSYVDAGKIFITGFATGGTMSLLLAQKEWDIRGYVAFSPAAQAWKKRPLLQETLQRAVQTAKAPIFVIQPQNDFDLKPIEVLGEELRKKGAPNRSKVFAAYGASSKEANTFAIAAPAIWGADVLSFFKQASR